MGYRIVTQDFTVEVDTLIEFHNALNTLRSLERKHKAPNIPEPPSRPLLPLEPTDKLTVANKIVSFYRSKLPSHTMNMLNALYDKPEGLTSEELQNILNVTHGGLGGALGGITKAAKPHGLHGDDIVSKPKEGGGLYKLTSGMRDIIQSEKELPKRISKPIIK
jgi:hypothetical protein